MSSSSTKEILRPKYYVCRTSHVIRAVWFEEPDLGVDMGIRNCSHNHHIFIIIWILVCKVCSFLLDFFCSLAFIEPTILGQVTLIFKVIALHNFFLFVFLIEVSFSSFWGFISPIIDLIILRVRPRVYALILFSFAFEFVGTTMLLPSLSLQCLYQILNPFTFDNPNLTGLQRTNQIFEFQGFKIVGFLNNYDNDSSWEILSKFSESIAD